MLQSRFEDYVQSILYMVLSRSLQSFNHRGGVIPTKIYGLEFQVALEDHTLFFWMDGERQISQLKNFCVRQNLRPWSSWTANDDKKYTGLNRAALNVNKPCVTSWKTAFPKDK